MKPKWYFLLAAVLAVFMGIAISSALGSFKARITMEAESKAERRYRAELDAQQEANLEHARAEKAALPPPPKNAQQAVKIITQYVPLSSPIQPVVDALKLPDAPSEYKISGEQLKDIAEFTLKCKNCEADRGAYMANESLLNKKIASLERERDVAQAAARTGTKWQRFKRTAKTLGIGALVGGGICAAVCK